MEIYDTRYSELAYQNLSNEEKVFYMGWDELCRQVIDKYPKTVYKNKSTDKKIVYLSFDDAPDQYCTYPILKILEKWGIKATFSIIGMYIDENVELLKKIYEEGHAIINHTMRHFNLTELSNLQIEQEVLEVDDKLEQICGMRTRIVRLPYGKGGLRSCKHILDLGYQIAFWSYNTCDWVIKNKEELLTGFSDNIRNGEIVLLHSYENKEHTVEALPFIISELLKNGYSFGVLD